MMKANLLHRCSDETGEAATWLPGLDILLWVDIDNGILHQYHPKSKRVKEHTFPEMISSIIPWKGHEHEIILTMKNRLVSYHLEKETFPPCWKCLVYIRSYVPTIVRHPQKDVSGVE